MRWAAGLGSPFSVDGEAIFMFPEKKKKKKTVINNIRFIKASLSTVLTVPV